MTISVLTDFDLIKTTLIAWLKTYSSDDGLLLKSVEFKNQLGDRPAKPYGNILITNSGRKSGFDEERQEFNVPTDSIDKTTLGQREMKVQIDIYSEPAASLADVEALEILERALMTLETQVVKDLFKSANLSFIEHTPINELDQQLGERWERRAQTDLTLRYTSEVIDSGSNDNWIENAETPSEENTNLTVNI